MRTRCCRSVSYSTLIGRPRRAVAVHEIERGSSSGWYSRKRSKRDPAPGMRAALTRVVREPAPEGHLVAADLLQVRIHVGGRVRGNATLPLQEIERAAQADVDVAEAEGAPVSRARGVRRLGDDTRTDDQLGG